MNPDLENLTIGNLINSSNISENYNMKEFEEDYLYIPTANPWPFLLPNRFIFLLLIQKLRLKKVQYRFRVFLQSNCSKTINFRLNIVRASLLGSTTTLIWRSKLSLQLPINMLNNSAARKPLDQFWKWRGTTWKMNAHNRFATIAP